MKKVSVTKKKLKGTRYVANVLKKYFKKRYPTYNSALPKAREIYEAFGDKILDDWKFRKGIEASYGVEAVTTLYRDYKNALNNVLNYQIQSYAASIVNRAALQINRKFRKENIVGQVIAQIHDQLICQVRIEDVKRACEIVQDCMENTTKLDGVELIAIPEIANNFKDGH